MKTISKTFTTLRQATRYKQRLYDQYDIVRLIKSPFIGESGIYIWQVAKKRTK